MPNSAVHEAGKNLGNGKNTVDTGFTAEYNKLVGNINSDKTYGNRHYHKSLDFSDVGIPTGTEADANTYLRQFHQTRLYIQGFSNMNAHGKSKAENSTQTYLISANLPEQVQYKIGSKWGNPFSLAEGKGMPNTIMQFGTGTFTDRASSGINRMGQMKIWEGSDPLSLSLTIPVIDDGHYSRQNAIGIDTNFVEALEFLGSLCLPKNFGALGFYTPPPSPINVDVKITDSMKFKAKSTYGRIILQLGGMLLVDHCIIEGISVSYPNTKTMIRHYYNPKTMGQVGGSGTDYLVPLLATLTINITTVEAMTADYYSNMLWLKTNSMGQGNVDVGEAINAVKEGIATTDNFGANTINNIGKGNNSQETAYIVKNTDTQSVKVSVKDLDPYGQSKWEKG